MSIKEEKKNVKGRESNILKINKGSFPVTSLLGISKCYLLEMIIRLTVYFLCEWLCGMRSSVQSSTVNGVK